MVELPARIARIVEERDAARAAKDFARADGLRDELLAEGYALKDTPQGAVLTPLPNFEVVDPASIANRSSEDPTVDLSLHLLYEGFRDDVLRFLDGFEAHNDGARAEVILVDNLSGDGEWLESLSSRARILHLDREVGWATARNAGLKLSKGSVCVLIDLSIEPMGDIVTPLLAAFEQPGVGVAGPFGLISGSMRDWEPSDGPEVDAIEGYLIAVRRESLAIGLIHEKFTWYRNADIDLSFQVRAQGLRALVIPLPVAKHEHRAWEALDPEERAKRSKRNHYTFFDRWKDREDLLLSRR